MSQLLLNGRKFNLNKKKYSIGRGEDCSILLPESDGAVSRVHALLEQAPDGGWILTDLQSTNGTFLNKERIEPLTYFPLKNYDILSFAQSLRVYIITKVDMKNIK